MRRISLQSADLTNFKSFRTAHIDLCRGPGLRMVFGENRREPRLGANGAGKSTIFDGVEFCLGGRSVRGKRASELVTTGQKSMDVGTSWLIDNEVRTVKRTYPPERVYIDGSLADQRAVDELMGMSRDRRLASVLFGQARPLFIDLPVPGRGDLLDDVLGLGFWIKAAELATSRWAAAGLDAQRLASEIARTEGALSELLSEEDLAADAAAYEAARRRQVDDLHAERRELDLDLRRLRRSLVPLLADRGDEIDKRYEELIDEVATSVSKGDVLEADVERLDADLKFFAETGECPTCGQDVDEQHAAEHVVKITADRDEKLAALASAHKTRVRLESERDAVAVERRTLADRTRERHRLELAATTKRGDISALDNRIKMLLGQENPHEAQLRAAASRRAELTEQLRVQRAEEALHSARIDRLDFWRQGFRRVRVFCLERVLAELEVETMGAARSLGLAGWRVGFTGETETGSGTVRLGVRAVVASPEAMRDFDAWSPGEGQRIRCASALGLSSLIQRYSGVSYDLEVWDEPSAWLSAEGIDDLFECLRERAHARGKSIWVVDPRAGLSHGGFDEVWNVIKTEEGSRIEIARGG